MAWHGLDRRFVFHVLDDLWVLDEYNGQKKGALAVATHGNFHMSSREDKTCNKNLKFRTLYSKLKSSSDQIIRRPALWFPRAFIFHIFPELVI